jgi:group I intron endonuclease
MIVYCITNKINGKKYIGSDSNNNPKYYGSGTYIKKAIKKYGKENFVKETLCEVDNIELMKELEEYWIECFNAYNNPLFYNATKYAAGISKFPDEKKINVINANKGNKYHLGFTQSEYQKEQTRKANTGKIHTIDFKNQKRQKALGNKYALGNKLTEEQKLKITRSKINHECYQDPDRGKKISEKLSKPVLQYTKQGIFIKEYPSSVSACKDLGITSIGRSLKNWDFNSGGFKFKYK